MKTFNKSPLALVFAVFALMSFISMPAKANNNPFEVENVQLSYVDDAHQDHSCGEGKDKKGKCGEGKCGEGKKKGKCGEGKCLSLIHI